MRKQFHGLTSLRGLAALMIVVHHLSISLLAGINVYLSQYTPFIAKSYLWVDFFFILSGFILAHAYGTLFASGVSKIGYFQYLKARFARIYPLHIFMLILFILLELLYLGRSMLSESYPLTAYEISHPPFSGKQSLWSIFTNLTMIHAFHRWSYWNEPAWSIGAEWIIYLFIPFLIPWVKKSRLAFDAFCMFFAYFTLYVMIERYGGLDYVSWKSLVRCFSEAGIGILLYKIYKSNRICHFFSKNWVSLFFLGLSFLLMFIPVNHLFSILAFNLLILSTAHCEKPFFLNNPLFFFLGTISYSIYMTHWFLLKVLENGSRWLTGQRFYENFSLTQMPMLLIPLIGLVILFSVFTYYFVEKPFRNKIRNLKRFKAFSDNIQTMA